VVTVFLRSLALLAAVWALLRLWALLLLNIGFVTLVCLLCFYALWRPWALLRALAPRLAWTSAPLPFWLKISVAARAAPASSRSTMSNTKCKLASCRRRVRTTRSTLCSICFKKQARKSGAKSAGNPKKGRSKQYAGKRSGQRRCALVALVIREPWLGKIIRGENLRRSARGRSAI